MISSLSDLNGVCEQQPNARNAHDEEHDGRHDELCVVAVVMVLGQWIQCLEHKKWVCTKSNLGG